MSRCAGQGALEAASEMGVSVLVINGRSSLKTQWCGRLGQVGGGSLSRDVVQEWPGPCLILQGALEHKSHSGTCPRVFGSQAPLSLASENLLEKSRS